jgi:hypothetical protein
MSQDQNHLNHPTWRCNYHVVCTPKHRTKLLFGQIRRHLGTVFHEPARRARSRKGTGLRAIAIHGAGARIAGKKAVAEPTSTPGWVQKLRNGAAIRWGDGSGPTFSGSNPLEGTIAMRVWPMVGGKCGERSE